ncbi:MAG: Rnase Y domain-containing protein, partial [Microgenomates group bacterium]
MLQKFFRRFLLEKDREKVIEEAQIKAKEIISHAQDEAREIMKEAVEIEKRLSRKEEILEGKENQILNWEERLRKKETQLNQIKEELERKKEEVIKKLEKVAKLSQEEAKSLTLSLWEEKLKKEIAQKINQVHEEIKKTADEKAKEILVDAMRYGAIDYVAEYTLSTVSIPNEEFKGRIIGKEGRNIRTFELVTGVDVDLEEEGVIKLSSFDAVKREIARVALERLIKDGRIQPARIEEIVKKTKEEIEKILFKEGERLANKVGIYNLPSEIIRLLGRFKYRYSYGQNMIAHTLEETRIGTALA